MMHGNGSAKVGGAYERTIIIPFDLFDAHERIRTAKFKHVVMLGAVNRHYPFLRPGAEQLAV
jgi:hypothetical protein